MLGCLPATIDPVLLAEKGVRLAGRVPVRDMPRLRALLLDESGEAEIDIAFERSESSGVRRMRGQIVVAAAQMTCQRCLEPVSVRLVAESDAILLREGEEFKEAAFGVSSGEASSGETSFGTDALTFEPSDKVGPTVLAELIEDELLLVVPMVPMHPLDECPARRYVAVEKTRVETEKTGNPFEVLARPKPDTKRDKE